MRPGDVPDRGSPLGLEWIGQRRRTEEWPPYRVGLLPSICQLWGIKGPRPPVPSISKDGPGFAAGRRVYLCGRGRVCLATQTHPPEESSLSAGSNVLAPRTKRKKKRRRKGRTGPAGVGATPCPPAQSMERPPLGAGLVRGVESGEGGSCADIGAPPRPAPRSFVLAGRRENWGGPGCLTPRPWR